MIFESFNNLMDKLKVRGRIPTKPVARVAVETIAVENRWFVGGSATVLGQFGDGWRWRLLGRCFLRRGEILRGQRRVVGGGDGASGDGGGRFEGPGYHVS